MKHQMTRMQGITTKNKIYKYFILFILIKINFLFSCKSQTNSGFEILLYKKHKSDSSLIYKIYNDNIACVDWEHQSFLIDKSTVRTIDSILYKSNTIFLFCIYYNGEKLYSAKLFNAYYSYSACFNCPSVVYRESLNSIFLENWLIVNYLGNKFNLPKYNKTFNEIKKAGFCIVNNWDVTDKDVVINWPINFADDFEKRFPSQKVWGP